MIKHLPFKSLVAGLCCMLQLASYAQAGNPQANITRNPKDNTVKTVSFNDGEGPFVDNINTAIRQYMEFGSETILKLKFSDTAKNGTIIQRYNIWHDNIPVEHGSVSVMITKGHISFMNAVVYKPSTNSVTPVLAEQQALDKALAFINASEYAWEHVNDSKLTKNDPSFQRPVGTLVWVEDFNNDVLNKQLKLAYRFDISANKPLSRDLVYIDANTGNVLLKDAMLKHVAATGQSVYSGNVSFETTLLGNGKYSLEDAGRNVYTYDMHSTTDFPNSATDFENATTTWGKDYSIDAHWGATKVYDYWMSEHGRNSYDGFGADVVSLVNFDFNYNNAGWTGSFMIYGNGTGMFAGGFEPLVAFDVCAHELGHAICQHTADLVYARESGAMNEGFSDIWGAVIENYATTGKDMWSMGEELRMGALRSMRNPNMFNNPDTRGGTHWTNVVGCSPNSSNDQCGVHNNSGVLNHWFYLLSDGGSGTNDIGNYFEVSGLGVKKAAQIAYATERLLGSTNDYDDCRTASINYAINAFGACSREVEAITRAWYAVNVGADFVPCAPQIGFVNPMQVVNKNLPATICPVAQVIAVPLRVSGGVPANGNATVTVAGTGNVINGADYSIANSTLTFNAGSTTGQNVLVSIYDNGDVTKDKTLKLYFTITQNGSNAITSYTYDTCVVVIKGSRSVPDAGTDYISQVNTGGVKSKAVTPFFSRNSKARMQFVVSAEQLAASGARPNQDITGIQFNVTEKNSTNAYTDFTVKIDAASAGTMANGGYPVSTTYYNGSYTTQPGWNTVQLSTPLQWNGTDNLAIETCFNNASADANNDYVESTVDHDWATVVKFSDFGSGCALSYTGDLSTGLFYSMSKPVIRLVQPTNVAEVEKTISSSRQWDVDVNQDIYFSNTANDKLIANISKADKKLGCTNAFIMAQGDGTIPMSAPFAGVNRSVKEFTFAGTSNQATTTYDLALYFDTSELSGINLANARILATSAAHDTLMNTNNSYLATTQQVLKHGYYSFTGTFTGLYTKYFLVDNNLVIPKPESVNTVNNNSRIRVVNNPFTDRIYINYDLLQDTKAQIRLVDITGKQVYVTEKNIDAGQHGFEINLSDRLLIPGNYVLQIITGSEVMVQKMVKQ